MSEIEDAVKEAIEARDTPLNSRVAVLVAVTATLMAIGNIKDGNIVQNMTQAQARAVNAWSYYQSKSTKEIMAANMAEQLHANLAVFPNLPAEARARLEKDILRYQAEAKRYNKEKDEIKKSAEGYQAEYERLNLHDDQFDMAEACFTVAIALFGVTALTRKKWLFLFGLSISSIGFTLELAGFLGWAFHPDWLAKLLG